MRSPARQLAAVFACLAAMAAAPAAVAQSTAFTYQGMLLQSGAPLNGTADFDFMLFGTPTGGNIVSGSQFRPNVSIINGEFTVSLNYGSFPFTGEGRWLEIWMRYPAGSGEYTVLTPRQKITPVPYAHKIVGMDSHSLDAADGDPVNALVIDNIGSVGIGVGSNPTDRFMVVSADNSWFRVDSTNGDVHMYPDSNIARIINDSSGVEARTDLIVANWPQVAINGSAVGIGTVSPLRRLHVVDNNLWTARFESTANTYTAVDFVNRTANFATWTFGVMGSAQGTNAGALYIMRPASGATVYFAPNNWVGLSRVPAFRLDLPNIANGDGRARSNQWVTFSSGRWKQNVQPLDDALDKVMHMRGVSFDWKPEHGGAHDIGFVAEEVGKVVPELVTWEDDGEHAQGLAYDRVTALAVEAIKAQQQKIEALRTANAELVEQIAQLKVLLATKARLKAARK